MIQVILSKPSHLMMRYKGLKLRHRSANGVRSTVKEHGELGEKRTLWECGEFWHSITGYAGLRWRFLNAPTRPCSNASENMSDVIWQRAIAS
jgi:hypothetical protein